MNTSRGKPQIPLRIRPREAMKTANRPTTRRELRTNKTKKPRSVHYKQLRGFPLRFLADSNRRTRFCRPLTKPLIQGTLSLAIFVSRLRLQRYDIFFNLQIFCYFFLTFSAFFSQPYFGLFCIDFMAQSELQHSHGLLLFFMRLKY